MIPPGSPSTCRAPEASCWASSVSRSATSPGACRCTKFSRTHVLPPPSDSRPWSRGTGGRPSGGRRDDGEAGPRQVDGTTPGGSPDLANTERTGRSAPAAWPDPCTPVCNLCPIVAARQLFPQVAAGGGWPWHLPPHADLLHAGSDGVCVAGSHCARVRLGLAARAAPAAPPADWVGGPANAVDRHYPEEMNPQRGPDPPPSADPPCYFPARRICPHQALTLTAGNAPKPPSPARTGTREKGRGSTCETRGSFAAWSSRRRSSFPARSLWRGLSAARHSHAHHADQNRHANDS
jgi:hypothetical protein